MKRPIYRGDQPFRQCPCGWAGRLEQLALWVRNNQIVARICPKCGSKAAAKLTELQEQLPKGELLH